eukprot:1106997-Rhodomonas_salina.1
MRRRRAQSQRRSQKGCRAPWRAESRRSVQPECRWTEGGSRWRLAGATAGLLPTRRTLHRGSSSRGVGDSSDRCRPQQGTRLHRTVGARSAPARSWAPQRDPHALSSPGTRGWEW